MALRINQRSLQGAIDLARAFFRTAKNDLLDTVVIKADQHRVIFSVTTQFSGMSAALITEGEIGPTEITVAFKDLQTALGALNADAPDILITSTDDTVTLTDIDLGSTVIPSVIALQGKDWKTGRLEKLATGNCQAISYVFKKALNILPSVIPEYDGLYIYKLPVPEEDIVWGVTVDQSTCFKTTHFPIEVLTTKNYFRIPTRILAAISEFTTLDKTELQLTLYKLDDNNAAASLGDIFWFYVIDDATFNPKLERAVEFKFVEANHIVVNRTELLQNALKMFKATTKNDSPRLTISPVDQNTIELSVVQKPADIVLTKRIKSSLDCNLARPLQIVPKHLCDALQMFEGEKVTISVNDGNLVQLSGIDKDVVSYVQLFGEDEA